MIPIAIVTFREFLEAFLIIGLFLGISKKLHLKKEEEILFAAALGILLSLLLPIVVFVAGDRARTVLSEKNADILEGYLLFISGLFISYVVFSLHRLMSQKRKEVLSQAQKKMEQNIFDLSLFATIVFFITREGFEIALFTATTSLFSLFIQNIQGLLLGFFAASFVGVGTYISYLKLSLKKIFTVTEFLIILFGAAMVGNGLGILFENYFHISFSKILPISLHFLPNKSQIVGHLLNNLFGIEQEFSFIKLAIILVYVGIFYLLFRMRFQKKTS